MEVQKVRSVVIGFENREIFLAQVPVLRLATMEGEEKRIVSVVRVEQIHGTEIESAAAGDRRKECVKQIVFLFVELGVMDAEDFIELGASRLELALYTSGWIVRQGSSLGFTSQITIVAPAAWWKIAMAR